MKDLIFVYNADSTPIAQFTDLFIKLFAPKKLVPFIMARKIIDVRSVGELIELVEQKLRYEDQAGATR